MKRFLLFTLVAMLTVVSYAQKPTPREWKAVSAVELPSATQTTNTAKFDANSNGAVAKAPRKAEGDVAVTPPEGLETKTYPIYAENSDGDSYEATAEIGVDGEDVYVKGLGGTSFPDAWVKGSMQGGQLVIPIAQYLGAYGSYSIYLIGSNGLTNASTISDVIFDYDADADVFMSATHVVINAATDRVYFLEAFTKMQIGGEKPALPDPVTVPDGVTMDTWTFHATQYTASGLVTYDNPNAKLGFDGSDVYFSGFSAALPDAVIKGVKNDDGSITFPAGQLLAVENDVPTYFVVYQAQAATFTFDGDKTYVCQNYFAMNKSATAFNFDVYYYSGSTISQEVDELVTVPEGLQTEEYLVSYKSDASVTERDSKYNVNVGFDGNDVYVQGIWSGIPDAWIKGTINGDKVVFPYKQFLGAYSTNYPQVYFTPFTIGETDAEIIKELVFDYDAENKSFVTEDNFAITVSKHELAYFKQVYAPEFKPLPEQPATPATPSIVQIDPSLSYFVADIPTVSNEGKDLLTSKLYIKVYFNKAGTISEATFTAAYFGTTEDVQELPYVPGEGSMYYFDAFGDDSYPEGAKAIMFTDYDFMDYNRVGIQTVYYGADERHESEIGWIESNPDAKADPVADGAYTFNFNALDPETTPTSNLDNSGDITEDKVIKQDGVSLTISPSGANTPNRFWLANNVGIQLRVYGGTLTFSVPEGSSNISKIVFNNAKWNDGNTADSGAFEANTWKGDAQTVVVTIAGNTQLNSIEVTVGSEEEENPIDKIAITPAEGEVESLQNFVLTVGDFKVTANEDAIPTINDASGASVAEGGMAANEDGTAVNIDFEEAVTEAGDYVLTIPAGAITIEGYKEVVPELTFKYTVAGAPKPDYTIEPAEGEVESLSTFTITFNNYMIEAIEEPEAILFNNETEEEFTAPIYEIGGKQLYISFDEVTTPGEYTLVIPDGAVKKTADESILPELDFFYTIVGGTPEEDVLVELPEDVEPEDWYLDATGDFMGYMSVNQDALPVKVAFDGDDVYLSGLSYFFPEAYVKGTVKGDQIIVPAGQFVGGDQYGNEYMVGSEDNETVCDIVFSYDAEGERITSVTPYILENDGTKDEVNAWVTYNFAEYYKTIVPDELVTPPADMVTEVYTFKADKIVSAPEEESAPGAASKARKIAVEDIADEGFTLEPVEFDVNVGFDGDQIYVQGFPQDWLPEAWVKGTVDGETVTFDDAQYLGDFNYQDKVYPMYFHGTDWDEWSAKPLPFTADADMEKITIANANDCLIISGGKKELSFYSCYTNVVLEKKVETGIDSIDAEDGNAKYFDLQGRAVKADTKGVIIRQTIGKDGKVQVKKIVRK